jgi:starch phosphorylase
MEGYVKGAGWAVTDKQTYENDEYQDKLDAATIYSLLEKEIIPMYYAKGSKGFSSEWVMYIKNSIAKIAPRFTTKRMLDDYLNKFYIKLAKRSAYLSMNQYAKAKELAAWKAKMAEGWDNITIVPLEVPDFTNREIHVGEECHVSVRLEHIPIKDSVGIELVIMNKASNGKMDIIKTVEMSEISSTENSATFVLTYRLQRDGLFSYALRVFPKHPDLPHRQDFCYVKWFS